MKYDFTKGSITKKLILFVLPILLTLVLQQLYGAVDLWAVGKFADKTDSSAVSTGYQLISIFINLVAGFAMGTTIILSNKIGAKDTKDLGEVIGTSIFIFFLFSIVLTLGLGLNGIELANMIKAPTEAFYKTSQYISILGFGSIFLVGYNVLGGIFRGLGDSRTPLIAVVIATVVNIGLDILFVKGFSMGSSGAAIATIIAQAVSVIFSIIVISRKNNGFEFHWKMINYSKKYTNRVLFLGAPVGINAFLVGFSFTFMLGVANTFGVNVSAGVGITERLVVFLFLIPLAFGSALATFVGQNVGANKHQRAKKGLSVSLKISLCFALAMIAFSLLFGKQLIGIFTKDSEVIIAGNEYLKAYCFDIFFTAFLFCYLGYLNGYGKTTFTMICGVTGAFAFRIPLTYAFSLITPTNLFLIGLATPIGTLVELIMIFFYYLHLKKEIKVAIDKQEKDHSLKNEGYENI